MKLNKEQITYIENYIKEFDIKYYEIYMEILDHMILAVEDILENDKEISLKDAIIKAKVEGFGKQGFRGMMEERMKVLRKSHIKNYRLSILTFFRIPQILLTISVFFISFLGFSLFENPKKVIITSMAVLIVYVMFDWIKNSITYKQKEFKILKLQVFGYFANTVFIWIHLFNMLFVFGFKDSDFNIYLKIISSLIFTMCFISFLIYLKISKEIGKELKQNFAI